MLTVLFRCADGPILLRQLCGLVCESSSVSLGTLCCNNSKDWGNHDTCVWVCGVGVGVGREGGLTQGYMYIPYY